MFYLIIILFGLTVFFGLVILKSWLINTTSRTFIAYKTWQVYPAIGLSTTAVLITKAILVITLLTGSYPGGRLIIQHHNGLTPKTNKS